MDNPWAVEEPSHDEVSTSASTLSATHRLDVTTPSWDIESTDAVNWKQPAEESDDFVWGSEKADISLSDTWKPPATHFDDSAIYAAPTFTSAEPESFGSPDTDNIQVSESYSPEAHGASTISEADEVNFRPPTPAPKDTADDPWTSAAVPVFEHDDPTTQDGEWGNTWTASRSPNAVASQPLEDEWHSAETRPATFDRDIVRNSI